jgi:hypothetical protein
MIAIFLIGEYDNNTELYINKLLSSVTNEKIVAFRCTFFEQLPINPNTRFLYHPCPQEIVATEVEHMKNWAYQECFNMCWDMLSNSFKYTIIVLPYNVKFDNEHFITLFHQHKHRTKPLCFIAEEAKSLQIPNDIQKINIKYYNLLHTTLSNQVVFENVFTPTHRDVSTGHLISNYANWKMYENCNFGGSKEYPIKCICIPSIIHIKHSNRSVFTPEERLQQTIRQIKSIRKYVKNARIVLLEMSALSVREMQQLSYITDIIWTFDKDPVLQRLANEDPNKNKAEVYVLREFWKQFDGTYHISHFAKFGGRYWFAKDVTELLFRDKPVMKQVYAKCYNQYVIEPVFYSIPGIDVRSGKILKIFDKMMDTMNRQFTDNERLLYDLYAKHTDTYSPEHLRIQGYTATSGVYRYY